MSAGLMGTKRGMTQLILEDGRMIPVTILEANGNVVLDIKDQDTDGYAAVQLGYGSLKRANAATVGHAKRANATPRRHLVEFRGMAAPEGGRGADVTVDLFEIGDKVDVTGTTKGRGFASAIKRHGFARQPQSHGGMARRRVGSIGQCAFPAEVFKGKRMPGHYGAARMTIQGLEIVKVDVEQGLIAVRGAVPGPTGGLVHVSHSVKGAKGRQS